MRPTLFEIPFWFGHWMQIPIRGYGLMLMIGFLGGTWWATRRALKVKANPDIVVNLGFVCLLASVVGARIFYVAHYWKDFEGKGVWAMVNITAGGLEFYGGLIGAVVAGTIYILLKRISFRLYADIVAPSIMFGMAMARIGCFLNGCCWGAPCSAEVPWSVQFPYGSPAYHREWHERMITVPAELMVVPENPVYLDGPRQAYLLQGETIEDAIKDPQARNSRYVINHALRFGTTPQQLLDMTRGPEGHTLHVHPAQLYASVDGLLLAALLSAYFYRRQRHGAVFGLLFLLYPITRIIEEIIRIDNPHDTAGLTISQFVSVVLIVFGLALLAWIRTQPLRSPRVYNQALVPAPGSKPQATSRQAGKK